MDAPDLVQLEEPPAGTFLGWGSSDWMAGSVCEEDRSHPPDAAVAPSLCGSHPEPFAGGGPAVVRQLRHRSRGAAQRWFRQRGGGRWRLGHLAGGDSAAPPDPAHELGPLADTLPAGLQLAARCQEAWRRRQGRLHPRRSRGKRMRCRCGALCRGPAICDTWRVRRPLPGAPIHSAGGIGAAAGGSRLPVRGDGQHLLPALLHARERLRSVRAAAREGAGRRLRRRQRWQHRRGAQHFVGLLEGLGRSWLWAGVGPAAAGLRRPRPPARRSQFVSTLW
mmetsp:Transcript_32039/g.99956  ORF Transcript_32039/g.99956 Transcript_32039/m.99956 type:complete len:278 (+) Transcript_32039:574-1407(+)